MSKFSQGASLLASSLSGLGLIWGVFLVSESALAQKKTGRLDSANAVQTLDRMRPARSTTTSGVAPDAGLSPLYSRFQQFLPPYVPNGMFGYVDPPSEACPVLLQIMDDLAPGQVLKRATGASASELSLGEARLDWLVARFEVAEQSPSRVVWSGYLQPDYEECEAKGFLSRRGQQKLLPEQSHLQIRMSDGVFSLILNMEPLKEGEIVEAGTEDGQPYWAWRGSW